MRPRLALSLCGSELVVELVGQPASSRLHALLRSLPLAGSVRSREVKQVTVLAAGSVGQNDDDLRLLLDRALSELNAKHGTRPGRLDLEVLVGLDHARIGVMTLEDPAAITASSDTLSTYAQAWVRQMLHVEPETQVIRWQLLEGRRKLLISCIDKNIFDSLSEYSARHRLRFVSCRPAVLTVLPASFLPAVVRGKSAAPHGITVVWTEAGAGGARSGCVQLLRFEGWRLSSAWRGWVPAPLAPDCPDDSLDGAVRRFLAHTLAGSGDAVKRVHWAAGAPPANVAP